MARCNIELKGKSRAATADRDDLKEVSGCAGQNKAAASQAGTSAYAQLIANTGRITKLNRARRIKNDL